MSETRITVPLSADTLGGLASLASAEGRAVGRQAAVIIQGAVATRRTSAATESAGRRATPRKRKAGKGAA